MVETVKEYCKHEDCKYRGKIGNESCCVYILAHNKRRGCKISKCDKYEAGELRYKSMMEGFWIDNEV